MPESGLDPAQLAKKRIGDLAARLVDSGTVVGLGTGSTAVAMIHALARRVREEKLRVEAISSSESSAALARELGIKILDIDAVPIADLYLDGADDIDAAGTLVKGGGGALLREKLTARACRRFVVLADRTKVTTDPGRRIGVPVEVVRFAHTHTARALAECGLAPKLRRSREGVPFVTDEQHYIYDCHLLSRDPVDLIALDATLHDIPGVVETGIFVGMMESVVVDDPHHTNGARTIHRSNWAQEAARILATMPPKGITG